MKNRNICKLVSQSNVNNLSIFCFIKESNPDVMKRKIKLDKQRMILVTQGEGKFKFDETEILFRTGTLVFGFANESFSAEFSEACEYMYVSFEGTRANELFYRFDINKSQRKFDGYEGLIPLWLESISSASEQTVGLAAESILLYTFSRLSPNLNQQKGLISKVITISEENFTDFELSITKIAEELGYNSKYLSHHFKEKMGVSYSEYLKTLRIKYAISLFEHGIDSVKNVALLSGFTDPLYFSTVFKKSIGVSPKDYLKRRYN